MYKTLEYFSKNSDLIQTIATILGGFIALITLIKAIYEYQLQGRQKRADYFDSIKNKIRNDPKIIEIINLLEDDKPELSKIPKINKYFFIDLHEELAIAINTGLIKKNVAHYFFGYFALRCWESKNFWLLEDGKIINKQTYYWTTFTKFIEQMKEIENSKINANALQKIYTSIFYKRLYRY
jgi:hypothetical protein